MIAFFIRGQNLTVSSPIIVADSVNYLTARFAFQTSDWNGLEKVAHFRCGDLYAEIGLEDDEITAGRGLNLTAGEWTVSVTGHLTDGGELIQRATTHTVSLTVVPSGIGEDGEPLPSLPSYGEEILAKVTDIDDKLGAFTAEPEPAEIPEWVQPTGAHDAYMTGDKVRYKGVIYVSLIDGNVWAPDVYPAAWEVVE